MQRPDRIIKNKVSEKDFEQIVYNWLSEGDYTPDDIIEEIEGKKKLFLMPLYFWQGEYIGSCLVLLGYPRREYYYTYDNVSKKQVRHSRTVTDWRPHSQQVQGRLTTICYAGGGDITEDMAIFIENIVWTEEELQTIPPDAPHYTDMCNLYEVNIDNSWKSRGYKKAYKDAVEQTSRELPNKLQMDLKLDIKFKQKLFLSILAPFWLFRYDYQGKLFHVIVDGNNPARINGSKPEDKKRKMNVRLIGIFGFLLGVSATIIALYYFSGESFDNIEMGWKTAAIVLIGIVMTITLVNIEGGKIKDKSKKIRQIKLSKRLKQLEN